MHEFRRNKVKLNKTSKALIVVGDSFVEGMGALTDTIWERYDWSEDKLSSIGSHLAENGVYQPNPEYMSIRAQEMSNAFPDIICKDYMKDWTPINFGYRGNGNRAAVKSLTTTHPDLNLHLPNEKIVVFMPSQFVRFDFLNDNFDSHNSWRTIWPHNPGDDMTPGTQDLWRGYATEIYSEVTGLIEFMFLIKELEMWCSVNNAKLVIVNCFEHRLSKEYFAKIGKQNKYVKLILDQMPWDKLMPHQKGKNCMVDELLEKEGKLDIAEVEHGFYGWAKSFKKGTPKGYFTPCAHPSIKGHELFAKVIYNHIKKTILDV
jgi:hypothetical protein